MHIDPNTVLGLAIGVLVGGSSVKVSLSLGDKGLKMPKELKTLLAVKDFADFLTKSVVGAEGLSEDKDIRHELVLNALKQRTRELGLPPIAERTLNLAIEYELHQIH